MTHRIAACLVLTMGLLCPGHSADLIEALPATDRILVVFFNEGHIDYAGQEDPATDSNPNAPLYAVANKVYYSHLRISGAAERATSYSIASKDDAAYSGGRAPVRVGRKAKGIDFNYPEAKPQFLLGHWVYLELPEPLKSGKTYTLTTGRLAENTNRYTFVFDERKLRSDTIHVNQIGFATGAPKVAYLSHWMGTMGGLKLDAWSDARFQVLRLPGRSVAFAGRIQERMAADVAESRHDDFGASKNFTLADLWECDFSSFQTPGEYVVSVPGIGCSYPFEIGDDVGKEPFYYVMKGLFYQRQGIVKHIEGDKVYPRDHHPDDVPWFYDPDVITANERITGFKYIHPVKGIWGFYHDAGDWDSYPNHIAVPYTLLLLYNLAPDKFADGDVGNRYKLNEKDPAWIEEGRNGIPDVLDEARWLIDGYRRARHALMDQGLSDGGVPGYIGREGITRSSWTDKRDWAVTGVNARWTMPYAAAAAWYAASLNRFWRLAHPRQNHPESAAWIQEAREAYEWSIRHGAAAAGKLMPAATLYAATGETAYRDDFKAAWAGDRTKNSAIELTTTPQVFFAAAIYALLPPSHPGLDLSLQKEIRAYLIGKANVALERCNAVGYRKGDFSADYALQHGYFSTPHTTALAIAHALTGERKYLDASAHAASYTLGGNQMNLVYLSGLGHNPDNAVFHPDMWLLGDSNSKAYSWEPLPGYITYWGNVQDWFPWREGTTAGVGSELWARSSAFPYVSHQWPPAEQRFLDRLSIAGGEFTVAEIDSPAALTYGYLRAAYASAAAYTPRERPTVRLLLRDQHNIQSGAAFRLAVSASADVRRVRYFYEWHYIGESADKDNAFAYDWNVALPAGEKVLITAVAYDSRGKITLRSAEGERMAVISDHSDPLSAESPARPQAR